MMQIDIERARRTEDEWSRIEASYRISPYFAPANLEDERSSFLASWQEGRRYEPTFRYAPPPDFPVRDIQNFLSLLTPLDSWLDGRYYWKATSALHEIWAVNEHDPAHITGFTCMEYGIPTQKLLSAAREILERMIPDSPAKHEQFLSATEACRQVQNELDRRRLDDWEAIVYEPMVAKMSVNRLDRQVRIRKGAAFLQSEVDRLKIHEVGVHVMRAEHGKRQHLRIFENSFPGYLATEEGLALYFEQQAGVLEEKTLKRYAGRVLGAWLALSHSFFEVFDVLAKYLEPNVVFDITVRAKRGFEDTSEYGAHTKDIVYLQGFLEVNRYLADNPTDLPYLMAGKIGIQDLDIAKKLSASGNLHLP